VKADIGIKDGLIAVSQSRILTCNLTSASLSGGNRGDRPGGRVSSDVTAGGIDVHVHFISPQQVEEAAVFGPDHHGWWRTPGRRPATTATDLHPGTLHLRRMLQAADAFPIEL